MISYDSATTIARPADEVFPWVAEPDRWGAWTAMSGGRWVTSGPPSVGSHAEASMKIGPFRRLTRWEITEYQPGQAVSFRTLPGGPVDWTGSFALEPAGTETTVKAWGTVRPNGMLRLLEPLMRVELPKEEAAELSRLKALLERRPGR
jgi:uncharacterized membrane protein